jgi:HEAT repeat protein
MAAISELVTQLNGGDPTGQYQARLALFQTVWSAGGPGKEGERAELNSALLAEMAVEGNSPRTKGEIARLLSKIGGDQEAMALADTLTNPDVREMARWSLDRIPSPVATAALVQAARRGSGTEFRVGAIGSLGHREGSEVVTALQGLAAEEHEPEVRLAALEALANHPEASSDSLFAQALDAGGQQPRVLKARVRLGDTLLKAGQRDAAKFVFEAVAKYPHGKGPQQAAAQRALEEIG